MSQKASRLSAERLRVCVGWCSAQFKITGHQKFRLPVNTGICLLLVNQPGKQQSAVDMSSTVLAGTATISPDRVVADLLVERLPIDRGLGY